MHQNLTIGMIEEPDFPCSRTQIIPDLATNVHCAFRRRQDFDGNVGRAWSRDLVHVDLAGALTEKDRKIRAADGVVREPAVEFAERVANRVSIEIAIRHALRATASPGVPGRCARRRNQFSFDQLKVFSIGSVQLRELCNGHQRLRAHVDSLLALGLPWACLGLALGLPRTPSS